MSKVKRSISTKEYREFLAKEKAKKSNKLGNTWCEYNGVKFQSKLERDRYIELLKLQRLDFIRNLELQPKFKLMDGYTVYKNGDRSNVRAITYSGDFKYTQKCGKVIVEDTKGHETASYKRTRKMALPVMFEAGIDEFREVFDADAKKINIYKKL